MVVTVAVLVVVFLGIFPKVADYSKAWSAIQQLPIAYLTALVVATVVNLAVYVWPLQAALPGLGDGPGFVVRQTGHLCAAGGHRDPGYRGRGGRLRGGAAQ